MNLSIRIHMHLHLLICVNVNGTAGHLGEGQHGNSLFECFLLTLFDPYIGPHLTLWRGWVCNGQKRQDWMVSTEKGGQKQRERAETMPTISKSLSGLGGGSRALA